MHQAGATAWELIYTGAMLMKRLWSPWRMKYIATHDRSARCIFCAALEENDDDRNLVVVRGRQAFVILNRYPYASAHLMVAPNLHQPGLAHLDEATRTELMELLAKSEQVIGTVYRPHGFNIGANVGEAAGAGVAGHLHFHIVPRWSGDTNFMTTLANTRVLPEELEETLRRLRAAW